MKCEHCGTIMEDAGPIGLYCPSKDCPGIAFSVERTKQMMEDNAIRRAVRLLESKGFIVGYPAIEREEQQTRLRLVK